ncbi:uncharacterized protein N7482_001950 [Penicillium canariense]|uniref:Uncharacterized protein n=1 Tax=Penicillium canariense TaxID=189055 RepID=A0A9W9LTF5_9EURO|nr:uncharacterized protein N7482_001950 [Penicillium canariense]KAJ5176073.1 hypothetical protein N7482_001950 [Penicillium canariense]
MGGSWLGGTLHGALASSPRSRTVTRFDNIDTDGHTCCIAKNCKADRVPGHVAKAQGIQFQRLHLVAPPARVCHRDGPKPGAEGSSGAHACRNPAWNSLDRTFPASGKANHSRPGSTTLPARQASQNYLDKTHHTFTPAIPSQKARPDALLRQLRAAIREERLGWFAIGRADAGAKAKPVESGVWGTWLMPANPNMATQKRPMRRELVASDITASVVLAEACHCLPLLAAAWCCLTMAPRRRHAVPRAFKPSLAAPYCLVAVQHVGSPLVLGFQLSRQLLGSLKRLGPFQALLTHLEGTS